MSRLYATLASLTIGSRSIGRGGPCFVIAEAGVNHNGDVRLAHQMIDAAAACGVDAIKFQVFDPDFVASDEAPLAVYQRESVREVSSQKQMIEALTLPHDVWSELKRHATDAGLVFLATPFDSGSLRLLLDLQVPAIKVASGDVTNHLLLEEIGATRLPVILSTGMSTLGEIESAIEVLIESGTSVLALLHCVSAYPAPATDLNLRALGTLEQAFGLLVGLSDHSEGIEIPIAAVALGAAIVEKHFTLNKTLPGPDHKASLEPDELRTMVRGIRTVEAALGDGLKRVTPSEEDIRRVARRSLALARSVSRGDVLSKEDLVALRPAGGIVPSLWPLVVGRRVGRALPKGHLLRWEDLEPTGLDVESLEEICRPGSGIPTREVRRECPS